MPIDIVVDAMGSDKAPEPEVRGAVLAARQYDVRVHLVGPEDRLRPILRQALRGQRLPVFIVPATEWITMSDKAAQAVRSKRDSTMRVGLKMVREERAAGFFTAGNTGAAMATAKMVLGMLSGVDRPALATIHNPKVGLLSIGEEDLKGNSLTRDTLPLLRALTSINFIGNVEGRDLFNGHSDVAVCDGFVGNVALKSIEGTAQLLSASLRESLKSTVTSQVGALLSRKAFAEFKKRLDYSEYGGAVLLGVRGVCIIGHGSSNEKAIMNGIRVAAEFAQAEVNSGIESALRSS